MRIIFNTLITGLLASASLSAQAAQTADEADADATENTTDEESLQCAERFDFSDLEDSEYVPLAVVCGDDSVTLFDRSTDGDTIRFSTLTGSPGAMSRVTDLTVPTGSLVYARALILDEIESRVGTQVDTGSGYDFVEMEDVEMSDVLTTVEEYLADDLVTFLLLNNPTMQDPEAFLNGILEFLQYMQDLNMLNLGAGFAEEIIRGTAAVISADDQRFGDDDGDGIVNGSDDDYKGSPWTTDDHGSYAARFINWLVSSDDDEEDEEDEDFGLSICEIAPDLCGGSYSPDVLTFFDDYGVDQSTFYWAYIDMQTAYTTLDDLYQ